MTTVLDWPVEFQNMKLLDLTFCQCQCGCLSLLPLDHKSLHWLNEDHMYAYWHRKYPLSKRWQFFVVPDSGFALFAEIGNLIDREEW